jgi:integral membrane protein
VIDVELLGIIRRWHIRDQVPLREIGRQSLAENEGPMSFIISRQKAIIEPWRLLQLKPRHSVKRSHVREDSKPMKSDLSYLTSAALLEGTTLVILVGVAAPLKHLGGYAPFASVMGTVHGVSFVIYWWLLVRTATANGWPRTATIGAAVAGLVPFGGWFIAWRMRARKTT